MTIGVIFGLGIFFVFATTVGVSIAYGSIPNLFPWPPLSRKASPIAYWWYIALLVFGAGFGLYVAAYSAT